ncbi:nuclear transport factor 2 family protein [Streptomyces spinosirectus]|jgi:ketosteroid isomerase-like protein|uniref:nuclear transport factor 2 family protein n=1 Tax=Streptomyces TaxID=1883 RepID=UPI000D35A9E7|nr:MULTISPECIES: nuclear transport factor 2 family protein [Streptomyces]MBY8338555.1 nuclear transport factor 2 family protein [Streptomyces plumbidurans]PTM96875.1 uncharacterized protein DUF4440 [Streptomyces sp. VMFN-G11Ma]UIR16435.1 nuclear transport factor 2 family protein [Streptomyces spinosirectus]
MTDASSVPNEVAAYDDAWQKAMGAGDIATLRKLLRPDAVVVHHDGRFETGRAYLDRNEQSDGPRIVEFTMTEGPSLHFDHTAVITGKMQATVARGNQRRPLVASVTRTWVRDRSADGSGWSLVATASSGS